MFANPYDYERRPAGDYAIIDTRDGATVATAANEDTAVAAVAEFWYRKRDYLVITYGRPGLDRVTHRYASRADFEQALNELRASGAREL